MFLLELPAPELTTSSTDLLDSHYIISDMQKINSGRKQLHYWERGGPLPKVYDLHIATDNGQPVQQNPPHSNPKELPEDNFTGQYYNTT